MIRSMHAIGGDQSKIEDLDDLSVVVNIQRSFAQGMHLYLDSYSDSLPVKRIYGQENLKFPEKLKKGC